MQQADYDVRHALTVPGSRAALPAEGLGSESRVGGNTATSHVRHAVPLPSATANVVCAVGDTSASRLGL